MGPGGQESQIIYLPQPWNRGTKNSLQEISVHKRCDYINLKDMGPTEQTFIRLRYVTFDRYLLLTRKQHRGETMEQFLSSLRSLGEHCQLVQLEDDLLKDIFTANMIDQELQKSY